MCNQTPNFCHWLRCNSCPPTTRPRYARHLKRRLEILMYPSKQKASGMVYQRDWWRVAGFIMEKPEKHGLVHNGKARKTRPSYSWEILETTRGCSHSGPPDCWRAFQKYCFSSPDFAFCHALILTVIPGRVSGVMGRIIPSF